MVCEKMSVKGLGLALGVLWATAVLFVAFFNKLSPGYGQAFLDMVASVYPGYAPSPQWGSIFIATGYAFLDGLIGGCLIALLYNLFAGKKTKQS